MALVWDDDRQRFIQTAAEGGSTPPAPEGGTVGTGGLAEQVMENYKPPADGGGSGGGGGGGSSGLGGLSYRFPKVPMFKAPIFDVPTFEQAQQEPGYQFRLGAGREALEASAAARGTLRTGGTLKNIIEYGQQFGAQEYSNVFNRALQTYGTKYQGAKDMYAPLLAQYELQFGAEQAKALAEYQREWDLYALQHQPRPGPTINIPPPPAPPA